jgi:DNA invertase Pin-like site-specific DNA recombinase
MVTAPAPKTQRVVTYARVSTIEQARDGVSLDAQSEAMRSYCGLFGCELVEEFVDAGESAKSMHRPGLQGALQALRQGTADGLIVHRLDRLTRSIADLSHLIAEYFGDNSKFPSALHSVSDRIDTTTASGRLVLHVVTATSEFERSSAGERTRSALQHLRDRGVRLGAEPLGWKRLSTRDSNGRRRWRRLSTELETVDRIVHLRREGHTLRFIAEHLVREGYKTKRGGKWYASTVRAVLQRYESTGRRENHR